MTRLYQSLLKRMDKAIHLYHMIEEKDRILVGVSGGPDSLTLLKLLHDRCIYRDHQFSILAVHIDLGFHESEPCNSTVLKSYFENLGVAYRIVPSKIQQVALDPHTRKSPCFVCSHYRRKMIYETAHAEGCAKIAYGHHKDDFVETLMMNILYSRKIEAMSPIQDVFKGTMRIIRPLAFAEEAMIKKFVDESVLPRLPRLCPMDGKTRRQKVKEMIASLQGSEKNTNIRENIFKSFSHVNMQSDPLFTR